MNATICAPVFLWNCMLASVEGPCMYFVPCSGQNEGRVRLIQDALFFSLIVVLPDSERVGVCVCECMCICLCLWSAFHVPLFLPFAFALHGSLKLLDYTMGQ